jgi:hypothetical protein
VKKTSLIKKGDCQNSEHPIYLLLPPRKPKDERLWDNEGGLRKSIKTRKKKKVVG